MEGTITLDKKTATIVTGVAIIVGCAILGVKKISSDYKRFKESEAYAEMYDSGEAYDTSAFKAYVKKLHEDAKAKKEAKKKNVDPAEAESPQE